MTLNFSIWTDFYNDLTVEESVLRLLKHGFTKSELSINHGQQLLNRMGLPEQVGKEFRAFLNDHGYTVSQGHLSFNRGLCSGEAVEELKKEIDLFLAIGIENAVIHANGGQHLTPQERFDCRVRSLNELTDYIKGTPLKLCLENLGSVPETHTVERIREFIDAVGSKQLKICLDTGHLHLVNGRGEANQSQAEFIRGAGNDLCAMHVTNNSGGGDDHLMPFSSRIGVDWKEVINALDEIGYTGLFNLEILGENKAPLVIRDAKLLYIKQMLEYMTSEEYLST